MTDWNAKFGTERVQTVLPAKSTKLSAEEATAALAEGYRRVTGHRPSKRILGLLVGQSALETGNWASMSNYAFAGVKASATDEFVQYLRCFEIENGQKVWYNPPSASEQAAGVFSPCKFAAYKTAADGATAYVATLKKRAHWWAALQSGEPSRFIEGLSTKPAYFTADPNQYLGILQARMALFTTYVAKYSENTTLQVATGVAVSAALYYGYRRYSRG